MTAVTGERTLRIGSPPQLHLWDNNWTLIPLAKKGEPLHAVAFLSALAIS